jgi:hypothetical protein
MVAMLVFYYFAAAFLSLKAFVFVFDFPSVNTFYKKRSGLKRSM